MFLTLGDPKPSSNWHEKSNQEKKKTCFIFLYFFNHFIYKRERERDLQLLKRRQSFITNNNGSANDKQ